MTLKQLWQTWGLLRKIGYVKMNLKIMYVHSKQAKSNFHFFFCFFVFKLEVFLVLFGSSQT